MPYFQSRTRYIVVFFMVALAMVTYLDRACIGVMSEAIQHDLGLTKSQMGYVFSAFSLAYAAFEIPTAWWADRRGARTVLTRIVLWWSVFTMATAGAFSFAAMLLTRFLFGAGEAGAWPCVARVFSRWLPHSERGTIKGVFFAGAYAAGSITPVLVVHLMNDWHLSWRIILIGFGATGFFWAYFFYRWFRDEPTEHPSVSEEERELILAGRHVDAQLLNGWAYWSRLLSRRNMILLCVMYVPNAVTFYFCITWLPTYLKEHHHAEKSEIGFLAALPLFLSVGTQFLGGWLSDWVAARYGLAAGRRVPAMLGYSMASIFVALAVSSTEPRMAALLIALSAASCMLSTAPAWGTVMDIGREHSAVVGATMNTAGQIGAVISPIVVAKSVEWFNDWNLPLVFLSGMFAIGAVCWLFIDPLKAVFESGAETLDVAELGERSPST